MIGSRCAGSRGLRERLSREQLGGRVGQMADDRSESAPGSSLILHLSTQCTVWGILRPEHGVLVLTLTGGGEEERSRLLF